MTSAARGRTMCAPTERKRKHAVCALGLLPSGEGIAGGASPSPTILKKLFRNLVVEVLGPPADHVPAATSSATPGAGTGPQQRQFLQGQGPVARREFRHSLRFCAPKIQCQAKGVTLVMGVLGGGRHGGREALPNLPIAPTPWLFLVPFPREKGTRPAGRNPAKGRAEVVAPYGARRWRRNPPKE